MKQVSSELWHQFLDLARTRFEGDRQAIDQRFWTAASASLTARVAARMLMAAVTAIER